MDERDYAEELAVEREAQDENERECRAEKVEQAFADIGASGGAEQYLEACAKRGVDPWRNMVHMAIDYAELHNPQDADAPRVYDGLLRLRP